MSKPKIKRFGGRVYVARVDLVCVRAKDDPDGDWVLQRKSDPLIDDIENGLPEVVDCISKGDVFIHVNIGDADAGSYYFGTSSDILVDCHGQERVFCEGGIDGSLFRLVRKGEADGLRQ